MMIVSEFISMSNDRRIEAKDLIAPFSKDSLVIPENRVLKSLSKSNN